MWGWIEHLTSASSQRVSHCGVGVRNNITRLDYILYFGLKSIKLWCWLVTVGVRKFFLRTSFEERR